MKPGDWVGILAGGKGRKINSGVWGILAGGPLPSFRSGTPYLESKQVFASPSSSSKERVSQSKQTEARFVLLLHASPCLGHGGMTRKIAWFTGNQSEVPVNPFKEALENSPPGVWIPHQHTIPLLHLASLSPLPPDAQLQIKLK